MKKILQKFQSLRYRQKLILLFGLVGILPLIIIGVFCYHQTVHMLETQEHDALTSGVDTAAGTVRSQKLLYENLLSYLSGEEIIVKTPGYADEAISEQFLWLHYSLDVFVNGIYTQHPEISRITVYTDAEDFTHGNYLRPLSDLTSQSWYRKGEIGPKPAWHLNDDGSLLLVQRIPEPYSRYIKSYSQNCIGITLNVSDFVSGLENISTDYHLVISDEDQCFYEYTSDSVLSYMDAPKAVWTSLSRSLGSGWTVVLERPTSLVLRPVNRMAVIVICIILICIVLLLAMSTVFSDYFLKRIRLLHATMQKVRGGDFNVQIHDDCPDEIGELTNAFQTMVDEINRLILEDYRNKLELKESQLKALQAQINPHFLYNCLSLINSRALLNAQPEISQMSQLLSTFYRTTLNRGKSETTLASELKNVTSYVEIQQLLHDNCFDATFQTDPSVGDVVVPNLLLQPLVENAIMHGILPLKEKRGRLFLTVCRMGDRISFTVLDNGVGIPQEKLASLTRTDSGGYGLKNVHDRLRLMFGEACGLTINSREGESTMITFMIPAAVRLTRR